MKKMQKVLALSLGSVLALSMLTLSSCGGNTEKPTGARICFDNLPDDGIQIATEDTQYKITGVESISAVDADGNAVADVSSIATYDEATEMLTAKSEGVVTLKLKGDEQFRVEVVPAYITDPNNQYRGNLGYDTTTSGDLCGGCHDPSMIEVEENGAPAYYIFSTGWNYGNEIRRSTDLIHWEYQGKATKPDVKISDIEEWIGGSNASGFVQWWAPDIVAAPDGGYWLYTCCVSNGYDNIDGMDYSKACIVLFYSNSLNAESFRYEGVLMQSCIPHNSTGNIDINSIDPQIIYDTNGNMYMAYGSFGTGNWMLELDAKTGLRKDGKYKDGKFLSWEKIRDYRDEAVAVYAGFKNGDNVKTDFYGTMISQGAMEAPVYARHDNVTVSDETGAVLEENKTFFYTTHSYNPLEDGYAIWGGRSESVWGTYTSVNGGRLWCGDKNTANTGNKYMGSFTWNNKTSSTAIDIVFPGHNDLFTTKNGTNIAAYITRTWSYRTDRPAFMVQHHQYYLNSFGDICINPNRYGGEVNRTVSKEELFKYTDGGKFKMVSFMRNAVDPVVSVDVVLTEDGKISYNNQQIGSWVMYGKGYIKFDFDDISSVPMLKNSGEYVYYGVVRPAWLDDQNKSGFTITTLGHSNDDYSVAMFMNNYSTMTGTGFVG